MEAKEQGYSIDYVYSLTVYCPQRSISFLFLENTAGLLDRFAPCKQSSPPLYQVWMTAVCLSWLLQQHVL